MPPPRKSASYLRNVAKFIQLIFRAPFFLCIIIAYISRARLHIFPVPMNIIPMKSIN